MTLQGQVSQNGSREGRSRRRKGKKKGTEEKRGRCWRGREAGEERYSEERPKGGQGTALTVSMGFSSVHDPGQDPLILKTAPPPHGRGETLYKDSAGVVAGRGMRVPVCLPGNPFCLSSAFFNRIQNHKLCKARKLEGQTLSGVQV